MPKRFPTLYVESKFKQPGGGTPLRHPREVTEKIVIVLDDEFMKAYYGTKDSVPPVVQP